MTETQPEYDDGITYRISALSEGQWVPLHEAIGDRKEAARLLREARQNLHGGGFAPEVQDVRMSLEVVMP
jgi:hypothetical protein